MVLLLIASRRPLAPLCLLLLLAAGGCREAKPIYSPARFRQAVERLIAAGEFAEATELVRATDPKLLAEAAVRESDVRLLVIAEETIFAPGVEAVTYDIINDDNSWVMPGTSDVIESRQQGVWHDAAYELAAGYNQEIVSHLRTDVAE